MNKTAKNSIIYLAGTIVMALVGFVSSMLLTRVLSMEVYALHGLLSTFATTAVAISAFGMDTSYARFYYNHSYSQRNFLLKCVSISGIAFLVLAVILLEPHHFILKRVFSESAEGSIAVFIVVQILVTLVSRFTHATARMEEHALNYVISNFIGKSGFLIIVAAIFLMGKDVSFLDVILSTIVTGIIAISINMTVVLKCGDGKGSGVEDASSKELIKYGFPLLINNTFILIIPLVEKVLVRELAGLQILSVYTAASVFATVILLMQNTLDNIWNPLVYKHFTDEKRFKPILHSFGLSATVITSIGLAVCILLRRWLVLILDAKYFEVYIIAPGILYGACFNIVTTIYSVGINVKKKTVHMIIAPAIQLISSLALCFALIPKLGLVGIGISSLVSVVLSRLYRIVMGVNSYSTGVSEWKSYSLCAVCVLMAFVSMFFTSFIADVIICSLLIALTFLIVNAEIVKLCKDFFSLLKKNKE